MILRMEFPAGENDAHALAFLLKLCKNAERIAEYRNVLVLRDIFGNADVRRAAVDDDKIVRFDEACSIARNGFLLLRTLLRGGVTDETLREVLAEAIAGKPRRHGFQEQVADAESRRMNEIGG